MGGFANYGYGGIDDAVYYSRRGQRITRWANNYTPVVGASVLTMGTLVYNLTAGETVMVSQMQYGLDTVSDAVEYTMVWTTAVNGGGIWFAFDITEQITTGAAVTGPINQSVPFDPPHRLRYEDGVRSITMRIAANDGATNITVGWDGWSDGCGEGTTTSTSTSTTSTSSSTSTTLSTSTSTSTTSTSSSTTSTSSSTTSTSSSTTTTTSTSTSTTSTSSSTSTSTSISTSTSTSTTSTSSSTTSTSSSTTSTSTTTTLRP